MFLQIIRILLDHTQRAAFSLKENLHKNNIKMQTLKTIYKSLGHRDGIFKVARKILLVILFPFGENISFAQGKFSLHLIQTQSFTNFDIYPRSRLYCRERNLVIIHESPSDATT